MTKIEWTHRPDTKAESWNFLAGCTKVSPGCKNCYALRDSWRIVHAEKHPERYDGVVMKSPRGKLMWTGVVNLSEYALLRPLHWRKPRTVFVASMSDLFHPSVPFEFIIQAFAVMALTPKHIYQVLTKRAKRMREFFTLYELSDLWYWRDRIYHGHGPGEGIRLEGDIEIDTHPNNPAFTHTTILEHEPEPTWPLPNVWLGVTAEDQQRANERIPDLLEIQATVRFVSIEPMLEHVDLIPTGALQVSAIDGEVWNSRVDWIVSGGESGHDARPMDLAWTRDLITQCQGADVPVFVKQLGTRWAKKLGQPTSRFSPYPGRKGQNIEAWPKDLRVREFPA